MSAEPETLLVETPVGPARVTLSSPAGSAGSGGVLLLGHGAGGGVTGRDLATVGRAAAAAGWVVGLAEQPYRVAGRRAPAPAGHLDVAFTAMAAAVRADHPTGPLVTGGRSSGARVACRTAAATGAAGVLALAFPLRPPGRPHVSRLPELAEAGPLPVLVVQGDRDEFGTAAELAAVAPPHVIVLAAPGATHALRAGLDARAVTHWLRCLSPDGSRWAE